MTYLEKLREVLPGEVSPRYYSGAKYCKRKYFDGIGLKSCCADCQKCYLQEWQGEEIREEAK